MDYTAIVEALNGIRDIFIPLCILVGVFSVFFFVKFFVFDSLDSTSSKSISKDERKVYQERIALLEKELVESEQRYNKAFALELEYKHMEDKQ